MRRQFTGKVDSTATTLIKYARDFGAAYLPLNGAIDGVLFYKARVILVDWKGPKTRKTETQQQLIDHGWPIVFISTLAELQAELLTEVRR